MMMLVLGCEAGASDPPGQIPDGDSRGAGEGGKGGEGRVEVRMECVGGWECAFCGVGVDC